MAKLKKVTHGQITSKAKLFLKTLKHFCSKNHVYCGMWMDFNEFVLLHVVPLKVRTLRSLKIFKWPCASWAISEP